MARSKMRLKLTCKETHRLISEGLDRDLSLYERLLMRMHLTVCDACTNFNGQMALLHKAMRNFTIPADAEQPRDR